MIIVQGSVATYLRCVGVVNNKNKKGLLLSLPVTFFKSLTVWQRNVVVSCTLRAWPTHCYKCTTQSTFFP